MPAWKLWLHGLIAAAVVGAATGASSVMGSLAIGDGLTHGLKVAGATGLIAGLAAALLYLKQSPVPAGWDGIDRRNGTNGPTNTSATPKP